MSLTGLGLHLARSIGRLTAQNQLLSQPWMSNFSPASTLHLGFYIPRLPLACWCSILSGLPVTFPVLFPEVRNVSAITYAGPPLSGGSGTDAGQEEAQVFILRMPCGLMACARATGGRACV